MFPLMATIITRDNSPYYFCAFTARDGRRLKKSTKIPIRPIKGSGKTAEGLRTEALNICLKWAALETSVGNVENQARKVLAEITERATGKRVQFYTLRQWLDRYAKERTGEISEGARIKYAGHFREFLEHLAGRADAPLDQITREDIASYRDWLAGRGLAPATIKVAIKAIKMPFASARALNIIEADPAAAITAGKKSPKGRKEQSGREDFKPAQIARLLASAKGTEWEGMIILGAAQGFRLGDCLRLKWGEVDVERGVWTDKHSAKTSYDHSNFPVHQEFIAWLKARKVRGIAGAFVFPELAKLNTGGCNGASARFRKLMKKAGVQGKTLRERVEGQDGRTTTSLTFHSLRHTAASNLKRAGVSDSDIQKVTGHSSPEMLAVYTHEGEQYFRDILAKNKITG